VSGNMDELKQDVEPAPKRTMSFGAAMKAVFWSFFGIRKRSDYEHDSANLNPVHVIIAGLIGVAIFIGLLVTLVQFAVSR
jgi:amino acid transporter